MLYYPNCSELVTHLNIIKIEDIRLVLKEIEKLTGWKVMWKDWSKTLHPKFKKANIDKIVFSSEKDRSLRFSEIKKTKYRIIDEILDGKIKEQFLVLAKPDLSDHLYFTMGDGYCSNKGLTLSAQQHCCIGEFEPLAKIIRKKNTRWHTHDGGSPNDFEEWCYQNNYEDVAYMKGL